MNWGKGIALLYISFVAFMGFMVFQSTQHDLNLVTKDYYEKDLSFEDHRQKRINASGLEKDVEVNHSPETEQLTFTFPDVGHQINGTILLFRPSDGKQDRSMTIKSDKTNTMKVSTAQLAGGHWRVQINWNDGVKDYYTEAPLFL